jgi:hypothetical protein
MTTTAKRLPSTITVHVPLKFTVRGGRKTILGQVLPLPHIATGKHFDDPIVKAIARAYRWRSLIEGGTYASITELAEAKSVNQSYACRLLRLTLLAPQIIEVALNRRISNLTLDHLMKPVPVRWDMHMASLQIHGRKTQSATLE